jgi:hypothetical protein
MGYRLFNCSEPPRRAAVARPKSLQTLLDGARAQIAVTDAELGEARRRRGLVEMALLKAVPGSRVYFNGSIAHGDANTPLTDFDVGVVVRGAERRYGPGRRGPRDLMERAREALRAELAAEFPKLTVTVEGQRRAVLVRFGEPVTPGTSDFTADVIVAVDNIGGRGIFIPNLPSDGWDPSDPETHTRLVLAANRATERVFARTMRLLKYWCIHHGQPLCSWHLKVLALDCITTKLPLAEALRAFFAHAAVALRAGPTLDPAGVSGPIEPNLPIGEVLARTDKALDLIGGALRAEAEGRPFTAQHLLALLLPGIVPDAHPDDLREEEAARLASEAANGRSTGVGQAATLVIPRTRAWGDGTA